MLPCLQAPAANKNSARLKSAAPRHLVPFQLVSPKNACPRPWTERNLYPDRSPFGDRFGFVRPFLNFCVVRAKHLAQIVGTALVAHLWPKKMRTVGGANSSPEGGFCVTGCQN